MCDHRRRAYCKKHDAYFCKKCHEWLENKCSDPECEFCSKRPVNAYGQEAHKFTISPR